MKARALATAPKFEAEGIANLMSAFATLDVDPGEVRHPKFETRNPTPETSYPEPESIDFRERVLH
jgi:hypothetical protein